MFNKKWCLLITALAIVALSFSSFAADGPGKAGDKLPKLQRVLKEVYDNHENGALQANETLIESRRIRVIDNKVRVVLHIIPGEILDEGVLQRYGVEVEVKHEDMWRVLAPIGSLGRMAQELDAVGWIRLPQRPHSEFVGQGVAATGADVWQSPGGYTGSGINVAVIDYAYGLLDVFRAGYTNAVDAGDIPAGHTKHNLGTSPFDDWDDGFHGTACAEIVMDMAPNCNLTLIKIDDEMDLIPAVNYCITNSIDIINLSQGWYNAGDYEGSGPLCTAVDNAYANGILVVKSAGNNQRRHYHGTFSDTDSDNYHNFAPGDNENGLWNWNRTTTTLGAGWAINIYLFWEYSMSSQDYDLHLYRVGNATPVASSTEPQTGTQPGMEQINYTVPSDGQYYFKIENVSATGTEFLIVHTPGRPLDYYTTASSYSQPGSAAGCLAVGAVSRCDWSTATSVDVYSSMGPTYDGTIYPDITGYTQAEVGIFTKGTCTTGFGMTSGAAPHVAGAAALVMEACPAMTAADVWTFLEGRATDMGPAGKDNEWGAGKLNMGSPTSPCPAEEFISVDAPNGGECWEIGSVHNVLWTSSGTSGLVDIDFSDDGGATWSPIFDDTADDGSEPWTVPAAASPACLIRITDADASHTDTSDGVFLIAETCEACEPYTAALTLVGYREVTWAPPFWTVQVQIYNGGGGDAYNVTARMNSDIAWLVIPDPDCAYGDIRVGMNTWGIDDYVFDLSAHPGGSFNVWFDVEYDDNCGVHHVTRLDPGFNPESHDETPDLTYKLGQNFPNPFNPSTSISFQIPTAGFVNLSIYDASGKLVRTLVSEQKSKGLHVVNWDGKDNSGVTAASGIYFYKLDAGSFVETKKMVLMR